MARYDHLPIWKDAMALARLLEEAVRRFPRYHQYTLGTDLRRQAYRCIEQAAALRQRLKRRVAPEAFFPAEGGSATLPQSVSGV